VFLDATYLHVRRTGQVTSMAVVVATGVTADGGREILGVDVGDSEDEVFWRGFLRTLQERGLNGVQLVLSDQHAGLVGALARQMQGVVHQRCRVHFARNLLALVPKSHKDMVAAVFRTAFAQPDAAAASQAWDEVRDQLARSFPKIGPLMDAAKAEVLAFTGFPRSHWTKIWSTNPIERINREIKRRTDVVGIFLRVPLGAAAGSSGFAVTLGEEPGVTRNLSVRPQGLDLVGASPPGSSQRWSRDLRAAC
jgi:putative transposase